MQLPSPKPVNRNTCRSGVIALVLVFLASTMGAQQVVQRGTFGHPGAVFDETEQWTTPLALAEDHDVVIYMPDTSTPQWLQRNYDRYLNKGTYILSLFTFYRTPAACRANQIAWGLGDAAHLNACIDIAYRVRRALIDPVSKSITLEVAAMVDQNGNIQPSTLQEDHVFRTWDQLDTNTQAALKKADDLISHQMKIYDARQQSLR
ncbi:hypothetical protein [Terriglobus sp. TAA 43]|uniref:hypothetical protein n=1 Tax=Terriglobus sp. TAA 43 TaxID=278961 RepID=UPI0006894477|nr:hypothetical protein [Terriglobus sp. TAA 43]